MVPRSMWGGVLPVLALTALLGACERAAETTGGSKADFPEQQTEDYHTLHSKSGVPVWELWGRAAERFPSDSTTRLRGVRMVFYREGAKEAELTSDEGEVDQKSEQTTARGNVVVVSEAGRRLESEVLHWDPERQLIHTEAFVRFTEGDQILTGYGMRTDPDLTDLVIDRQVSGEMPQEKRPNEGRSR